MLQSSCRRCRLARAYCLCSKRPQLSSAVAGCIIQHDQERRKSTSTGLLVPQLLTQFDYAIWHRTPAFSLPNTKPRLPVLVYPAESSSQVLCEPEPASQYWLVLDGTWQQTRKMLRQSPQLQTLPRLALKQQPQSIYRLRRNQPEQGLCTLEVVAHLLAQIGQQSQAQAMLAYLEQFMSAYEQQRQDPKIRHR